MSSREPSPPHFYFLHAPSLFLLCAFRVCAGGSFCQCSSSSTLALHSIEQRLLYNPRAVEEMRQVHAVRDTLWKLQALNVQSVSSM